MPTNELQDTLAKHLIILIAEGLQMHGYGVGLDHTLNKDVVGTTQNRVVLFRNNGEAYGITICAGTADPQLAGQLRVSKLEGNDVAYTIDPRPVNLLVLIDELSKR